MKATPKFRLSPLWAALTFILLAGLYWPAAYGSEGKEPLADSPAGATTDLLKRRLLMQQLNSQSGDPLYFMLRSNKTEVKPGEEVELTVSVHLLQDAHKTFIVYEELFGYTLRLVMPEGFVVTGGSYYDLLRDRLTRQQPVKTYNVKGHFQEGYEGGEFKLLRGTYYHSSGEIMVFKQALILDLLPENVTSMTIKEPIGEDTLTQSSPKLRSQTTLLENATDINTIFEVTEFNFQNCPKRYENNGSTELYITIKNLTDTPRSAYYYVCHSKGLFNQVYFELGAREIKTFTFPLQIDVTEKSIHPHVSFQAVGGTFDSPKFNIPSTKPNNKDLYLNTQVLPTPSLPNYVTGNVPSTVVLQLKNCPAGASIDWYQDNLRTVINGSNQYSVSVTDSTSLVYATCELKYCIMASNVSKISRRGRSNCTQVPDPELSSDIYQVMSGGNFKLTVENCEKNIKWFRNETEIAHINSSSYTTGETGQYYVSCEIGTCGIKNSNVISVSNAGDPEITADISESSVYANQKINLTAVGNCNTEWRWGDGQVGRYVQVTGPGTYSVYCKNPEKSNIFSATAYKTFTLKTINTPTLTQQNTLCLYENQTKYIEGTCPTGYTLYWDNVSTDSSYNSKLVGKGTYSAKCCNGEYCGENNSILVKSCDDIGCSGITDPIISIDPQNVLRGAYFRLTVENCYGSVTWYRNEKEYAIPENGTETSFLTRDPGSYYVKCVYEECDKSPASERVEPVYEGIKIVHNQPNNEIVAGVPFQLRALGCAEGAVEWFTAVGTTRFENPIWESMPGLYKARCVIDETEYSEWATVFMTLRSANTPQFYKPDQCYYANQSLYIAGNCAAGMTLRWEDNSTATSFPAYRQVTPGTYSAQCCNGGNCSAMTPVTVCTLTPNIQQINTNKDDPMTGIAYAAPNEPVLLTATGCDQGTVQWLYSGQTQWGNPVTVYGPGKYYARCFVTDHSTSPMISREIYPRAPGSVAIIPSQNTAFPGQMLTLTATGCNGGQVHWTYTEAGQTYHLSGRSVDVTGPNTYYAKCIVYGDTGPQSFITIPQASDIPKIITDKARVRPNETFTFQVDFSSCPGYGWPGGSTLVTQDGVTTTLWGWDPITLTGPALLEARCENAPWAKQTKEVFYAPGDNMRLVANKSKVKYDENVLLTTYGCDFGYVEWKIGDNMILGHSLDAKRQITQTGPGFYKARCKEDFMVNSDWITAYVDLDGSIVPVINGPASLCPNTAATVTTAGCPSGYYNLWNTLEMGGPTGAGNSITVYLPQTVKLRCIKNDNSWGSDEKPLTIASAIPDDIKITSNSPVVSGGTALLTGTSIAGASYLWTPPAGVSLPVLNTRVLQIPNATTAQAGDYQLKINSGGCEVALSARLDVDLCDNLYIKAFDPTNGEEKMRLNRKPGQLNLYDDLVLQVETFEGEVLKGVEYTWTLPQGVTVGQDPAQKHRITINKIGNYKVNVTSTGGVSCPLEVDISALACATPEDFVSCGSTATVSSTGTEKLKNLAVGDVFSTYDYVVSVTEVSGSEATGWTGRGFIEMSFLKLGPAALKVPLGVRFDNIHLNQCYQLLAGSKVVTEFDENWVGVRGIEDEINDVDEPYENLGKEFEPILSILRDLTDELSTFPSGDCDQKDRISKLLSDLEAAKTIIDQNAEYTSQEKTNLTTPLNTIITQLTEQLNCVICDTQSSARNASINCTSPGALENELKNQKANFEGVVSTFDDKVSSEIDFKSYVILPDGSIEFYSESTPNARSASGPTPSFIILVNTRDLAIFAQEYNFLRAEGYSVTKATLTAGWNVYSNRIHVTLDVVGFVPVFGEIADGVNGVIYAFEGDYVNAAFSAVSLVPVGGDIAAKGTKYTKALVEAGKVTVKAKTFYLTKRALQRVNDVKSFYGDDMAKVLAESFDFKTYRAKIIAKYSSTLPQKWQGHHILPRELIESSEVLRKAIAEGFDFNDIKNLIPLDVARHSGSHGNYTSAVESLIKEIKDSGKSEKQAVEEALRRVTKTINQFTSKKISDITNFVQ